MKRITLFLLLALYLSLQAFAQIRIGVDAGMNLTHFKSSDNYVQKIGGMGTGFQIGGTLMSGVSFMQTQSRMEMEYGMLPRFPDAKIKLNHIVIPLKVGYKFKISKTLSLIPSVGMYASYNFSAGDCPLDIKSPADGKKIHEKWNPMKGYTDAFYISDLPYELYRINLNPLRHWTYGGIAGLKAVIGRHYTLSFQYYEAIKRIQYQCSIRDYGYQLSVGYIF